MGPADTPGGANIPCASRLYVCGYAPNERVKMEKSDRLVGYGIGILALTAILLTWISHSSRTGRKAEPPKPVGVPWTQSSPARAAAPATSQESPSQAGVPSAAAEVQRSSADPDPRRAYQPPQHQADAPAADQPLPPDFSLPSDEEAAQPDSDSTLSPSKGESAAQRVGRRLRGH